MENAIYDPRTTRVVNGQIVRDPFPNNVIPRELLDPVALKIQDYIPRATRSGMINNWDQSFPADTIKSIATIKLDHNFTAQRQAVGLLLALLGAALQRLGRAAGSDHESATVRDLDRHDSRDLRLDADADDAAQQPGRVRAPLESGFRVAGSARIRSGGGTRPRRGAVNGIGFPVIGTMFTQTGGGMSEGIAERRQPAGDEEAAVPRQRHALAQHAHLQGRVRVAERHLQHSRRSTARTASTRSMRSSRRCPRPTDRISAAAPSGCRMRASCSGLVNNAFVSNPTDPNWRKPAVSVFVQDTWRVKGALTLDYGLRWDRQAYGYEEQDRRSMFSPDVANPAAGGLPGATIYEGEGAGACNCRFVKTYPYSFGPRVGVVLSNQPEDRAAGRMGHHLRADRHRSVRRRFNARRRRLEHDQLPVAGIRRAGRPCCAPDSCTTATICSG